MKKHTKVLVAGLVAGMIFTPSVADARVSTSVRVSTPRASVPRVSTPKVSTPKVSTPKPSSIKSGTSTLKPSKGTTVPRVNKNITTNKSTNTKNTQNTNKTTTKVDSGKYTVNKKTTTKPVTTVSNNYYNDYSTSRLGYNNNLGFWQYYGLTHMMHDDVSERDIAKELTKKGYSKTEINKILKDAKSEQNKSKKKTKFTRYILQGLSLLVIIAIILMILL